MPCIYEETAEERRANREDAVARITKPYKKKLDTLTRLLCLTLAAVDRAKTGTAVGSNDVVIPREVRAWAKKHKQEDARRAVR